MKLYLLRHGHALSVHEAGVASDEDRPLSQTGQEDVRKMARHLVSLGAAPEIILHSPLKRAIQTAVFAAPILQPRQGLEAFAPLSNELPAQDLAIELKRRCEGLAEVVAIGHQPQMGELIAVLSRAVFNLRPGGAAILELNADEPAAFVGGCNPEEL